MGKMYTRDYRIDTYRVIRVIYADKFSFKKSRNFYQANNLEHVDNIILLILIHQYLMLLLV